MPKSAELPSPRPSKDEVLTLASTVERLPLSAGSWVDGEFLVLRADTGAVCSLNNSGAEIWGAIDASVTVEEIAKRIADTFAVNIETARADVFTFVDRLLQKGLVRFS
jgi:Coenzyme PQQ synthesis protein D (PqqD)